MRGKASLSSGALCLDSGSTTRRRGTPILVRRGRADSSPLRVRAGGFSIHANPSTDRGLAVAALRQSFVALALAASLISIAGPSAALTLEEAIARALERNEQVGAAERRADAAGARVAKARSFFFPDLNAAADWTRREFEGGADGAASRSARETREGRLSATQTLFEAQAWPLLTAARRNRDAARFDALDARRRLAYETAEAYLATLNAERVARAAGERRELANESLADARARFEAQLVGSNDVTRGELEVATAERELIRAEGEARTTRLHLGYLLDTTIADSLEVPLSLLAAASGTTEATDLTRATQSRYDLAAEQARVDALRASAHEPLLRYLPDLGVTGSAITTKESDTPREEEWSVEVGAQWSLFDGGERHADRAERDALADAAELELRASNRALAVDAEAAQVQLESEQASLARAAVAVTAARRNATETSELYREGLARALEVVDANVRLFEAEVDRVTAQLALALAYLSYRATLGLDPIMTEERP
ncbi:MAG: TolC family protein [Candidatus Eisenbacteria bacterium]|nr:TolC family protein [Candidatus Eisenbacteria bacterium]